MTLSRQATPPARVGLARSLRVALAKPTNHRLAAPALVAFLGAAVCDAAWAEVPAAIEAAETCFVAPAEDLVERIGPYDCGYVVVPEDHAHPSDRKVRLGYVRLPARGTADAPPFFMLSGGPGSTLLKPETFSFFQESMLGPLLEDRDVVIIEERGSFHSVPSLVCPGLPRFSWLANRFGLDHEAAAALSAQAFSSCVGQARASGIDLAQYNSLAIVADIDLARQALGYGRIVYYGASYGSQLGQHLMRDHPETLAAVILDGASALSVKSWMEDRVINVEDGLEHLVATCEADGKCAEAYDIRALLDEGLALFDDGPIKASYTDPKDPATTIELVLTEADLATAVYEMQTGQVFVRSLPAMLNLSVANGRESMAQVLGEIAGARILAARDAPDAGIATLMHAAVVCSDDPVTSEGDMIVPEGASRYAKTFGAAVLEEYLALCAAVDVPPLPDTTDIDPVVDVPTLVLSGWLDVRTSTARSLEVAKALPAASLVTFWEGTHVQLAEINLCAASIVRAFVSDPTAEIDPSCVEDLPRRGFVLPDMTISVDAD